MRWLLGLRQMKWMAYVLFAFVLIFSLAVPAASAKKRNSHKKKSTSKKENPTSENFLKNEMLRHLGVNYRAGGKSPRGVDCSGYVGLVYRNAYGVELPHQSRALFASSNFNKISLDDLRTGDLLFFTPSKRSERINHVGIYLSQGDFVHAASGKGVTISNLEDRHWSERVAGARRIAAKPFMWRGAAQNLDFPFASEENGGAPGSETGTDFDWGAGTETEFLNQSLMLELGRRDGFNVSVFQDSLLDSGRLVTEPLLRDSADTGKRPMSVLVQGVRLERDIRPLEWVCVTPFVSYFNYDGNLDTTGLPRRSVGVDVAFGSVKDDWKLSTGFSYLSIIPPRGFVDDNQYQNGFNMALSYSRRVSDILSIEFIGERLQRYEISDPETLQQDRILDDQRFSVLFSFSY